MKTFLLGGAYSLLLGLFSINSASAQIVAYTTLGSGGSFNESSGDTIGGVGDAAVADSFVPTASGELTSIEVGIVGGNATSLTLNLYTNLSAGGPSAPPLLTATIPVPGSASLETVSTSNTSIDLTAGQTYWLALAPTDGSNTLAIWGISTSSGIAPIAFSSNGGATYGTPIANAAKFSMQINEAPEPATWTLMLGGLGTLVFLYSRKSLA